MTLEEFKVTLNQTVPPSGISKLLQSLWYDAKGDWDKAHSIAQDIHTPEGSWIHAYLHRKEGDTGNASYWYHRAGKKVSTASLTREWEEIAEALL